MATLTVLEVAHLLKVGENRVREMAASGELPAFRLGRAWGFIEAQVLEWLEQQVATQTAERQRRIAEPTAPPIPRSRGRRRRSLPALPPLELLG